MENPTNLDIIYDVSHAILKDKNNVNSMLNNVMNVIEHDLLLERATFTLKKGNYLHIEASRGLTSDEKLRGKYRLGEGITGKVAELKKPLIIPDISKEPAFLDRTGARKDANISFICVPIIHENDVIGTFSIDCPSHLKRDLNMTLKLMEIISNLLADGVALLRNEVEERDTLLAENTRLKNELTDHYKPANIIGNCNNMKTVYNMIYQVAASPATVIIRGESGTGKELIARAIHYASSKNIGPFIAVNCAALPENLIESELFGHEKGSFTGANYLRKGRFELANGGTLFLDEIGDISPAVQVKLLRVLQEKAFERIGSNTQLKTDARIIAATSRNLEELISNGTFREDLYYRLNVFPIFVPALRQRKTDITLLADYFLEKYNKLYSKSIKRISTPAINMLISYHWPGNVREFENCIERSVLISRNDVINAYDLPPSLQTAGESKTNMISRHGLDFKTSVENYEKELIVEAMKECNGNILDVSEKLNITQRILRYKLDNLKINPKEYKKSQ